MHLKISRFLTLFFVFVFLVGLLPGRALAVEGLPESQVIITEIRLGGPELEAGEKTFKEYITLYNQTEQELSLGDYKLEYIKDGFSGNCDDLDWGGTPSTIRMLDGEIKANEALTFDYNLSNDSTLTDSSSGSIRLVEDTAEQLIIHDLVGWGESSICFENSQTSLPLPGNSLQRYIDCETNIPLDTNDNQIDFIESEEPKPGELFGPLTNCPSSDTDDKGGMGGGSDSSTQSNCEGIMITEILPNPAGFDDEKEFIELYNPTSTTLSLEGCKLQTTANNNLYVFDDIVISPKKYEAFYSSVTGLTLTNSSGGSVYLINPGETEDLYQADYSPGLGDDTAWALDLSSNTWSITYSVTPGTKNKIVTVKPCPKGQIRNLSTKRCNKIAVEAGLGPCSAGKFRNPETNRCKSILDTSSRFKPCDSGEFRNPATNRCKNISSGQSLVPCKQNQERNPETNRCRKITGTGTADSSDIKDVLSVTQAQNQTSWAVAGASFAGATGYAVWEWRRELLEKLLALKNKLGFK